MGHLLTPDPKLGSKPLADGTKANTIRVKPLCVILPLADQ